MPAAAAPSAYLVQQVNGFQLEVRNQGEVTYFENQCAAYVREYAFTSRSDLADLDRLLLLELQSFRCQRALASGVDPDGFELTYQHEAELQKKQKDLGPMISTIKNDLGMNRSARDKQDSESPAKYLENLRLRAKAFGIHRNKQVTEALVVMNEIKSLIETFRRCNTTEKERLGALSAEEVLDHIEKTLIPRFDRVDAEFRANDQQNWIGTL